MSQPRLFEDEFEFEPEPAGTPVLSGEPNLWNYNHVLVGLVVGIAVMATTDICRNLM